MYCVMYEVRKQIIEVKDKDQGFENNQRRSLRSGQYKGAPQEPRVVGPEVRGHIIWAHHQPPQAPAGHVILDQSTLARGKTASGWERGYRAYNLGSLQGMSIVNAGQAILPL